MKALSVSLLESMVRGENNLCGHISVLSSTLSPCFLTVRKQPLGKLRQMVAVREGEIRVKEKPPLVTPVKKKANSEFLKHLFYCMAPC